MKKNTYDIIGIGSPFIDQIIHVSDHYLHALPAEKGSMLFVEHSTLNQIAQNTHKQPIKLIGGSTTNLIQGLAHLGHKCALMGSVGMDGHQLVQELQHLGITCLYAYSQAPTGQVLCLVTPDGERTFRVFAGASQDMALQQLHLADFEGASLVHVEGYSLAHPGLAECTMAYAKKAKALVSFDLANFEIAKQYRNQIMALLGNYVDVVFANAHEAHTLLGVNAEEATKQLATMCQTAVVTMNVDGCFVAHKQELTYHEAFRVDPLDSTGAGDLFASGFLHGYLQGLPPAVCARFGSLIAAQVVQVQGATLPKSTWLQLKDSMHPNKV